MEYFGVVDYVTYLFGTIMIILLPGPNSIYVLSLAAQQGATKGWAAALGVFVGDAILMILTAAGAVTILNNYPSVFNVVKILGAGYLIYIGLKLLYGAYSNLRKSKFNEISQAPVLKSISSLSAFNKALLVSLLNPKAILFFLSFFVQFVDPEFPTPAIPFFILAVTLQFFSLVYLGMLIYAGAYLADSFRERKKVSAFSSGSVGFAFIGFAVKLAFSSV